MNYRSAPILFGAAIIAVCIGLVVLLPPVIDEFRKPYRDNEKAISSLLMLAARVAINERQPHALQAYVDDLVRDPQVLKVVVSDRNNRVIARSWKSNNGEDSTVTLSVTPYSHWTSVDITDSGRSLGTISLQFAEHNWQKTLQLLVSLGVVSLGGGLLLILLSWWTATSMINFKLSRLAKGIKEVSQGNFDARVQFTGTDEIGRLGAAFDQMVQGLERSTRALRQSEERFELAAQGTNDGIWDWNTESNSLYLSPRFKEILGYSEKELPGLFNVWLGLLHPNDKDRVYKELLAHLDHPSLFQSEFRMRTRSGEWRWILGRGQAVVRKGQRSNRMVGSHTDITFRKEAENTLFREKERLLVTLQSISDGVVTADLEGRVEYLNPAACKLTGWTLEHAQSTRLSEVLTIADERSGKALPNLGKVIARRNATVQLPDNTVLINLTGERFNVKIAGSPLKDSKGETIGVVLVFHNTTERRELINKLSHHATHDSLTHLINRYEFESRLHKAVESARTEHAEHVMAYLDLDQFKFVNDTAGHAVGDQMLQQIARVLSAQFRAGDTVARLGGDDFGLLLERCPLQEAVRLADKARQAVKEYRFSADGQTFSVGMSIGLVQIQGDRRSPADLLSAADQACNIAKEKGRDRLHVLQPDDDEAFQRSGQVEWATKLQEALENNRFVLFAQRIAPLDPAEQHYRHYEVLLRMKDPKGKIVAPGAFLPAAERYGKMAEVDRWVVRNTMEALASAWQERSNSPIHTVAMNLSGGMLGDEHFLDFIKANLKEFALPPKILCFEITETVAIANFGQAEAFIGELKALGCRFSLDDFGSGFASFSYLKTLPVDYLKIDGSFVRHMDTEPVDHAMVDVINRIGQVMELKTIAEFVENAAILDSLKKLGVNYAQGYHIAKPRPLYEVIYPED